MRKMLWIVLLLLTLASVGQAQQNSSPDWTRLQFLIGRWTAVGSGSPGEGRGEFSFAFDLQNRVMVRRSHTDYPATANQPAFAHDDLIVIHAEGSQFKADYYDNEGHVIRYSIEISAEGRTCTFVSAVVASQPRFRLTYTQLKPAQMAIKFEIASGNNPADFKVYVAGTAQKK